MTNNLIGIALGGGCARGWAHIGVLKALIEGGVAPSIVAGTSIGAVAGGCFAADHLSQLEEFACSLTRRKVFGFLDLNLGGPGLMTGRRLCDQLDVHLKEINIEDLGRSFVAVSTEIGTGHEVWLTKGRLVNAMRASYALPGIFRPVKIDGRWLFDGALVNPIPVSVCRALGARIVIAVNLNDDGFRCDRIIPDLNANSTDEAPLPDNDFENEQSEHGSTRRLLRRQFIGRNSGAPGISRVLMEAFNITQDRIARSRLAGDPPDITITPDLSDIGLFEFHRAEEMIEQGAAQTRPVVDQIRHIVDRLAA